MPLCTQYYIDKLLELLSPAPDAQKIAALEAALLAARADAEIESGAGKQTEDFGRDSEWRKRIDARADADIKRLREAFKRMASHA